MADFIPTHTFPLAEPYDSFGPPFGEPLPYKQLEIGTYMDRTYFRLYKWEGDKKTRYGVILDEEEMDKLVEAYLKYKENK